MPNPGFAPTNPAYYTQPDMFYAHISKILAAHGDLVNDPEDKEIAFANEENLKAFLLSRMPQKPDKLKDLQELLKLVPELKVDPSQYDARRALSAKARDVLADCGARRHFSTKMCDPEFDRTLWVLLGSDSSKDGLEKNTKTYETLEKGTPEQRGKLLEERVNASMELCYRVVYGQLTHQEIIENFGKLHELQDLMANARNLLPLRKEGAGKYQIAMSDDIAEKLQFMERYSSKADVPLQIAKMIASADFEFLALENMPYVDQATFDRFSNYVTAENEDAGPLHSMEMYDTQNPIITIRSWNQSVRKVRLMEAVEKDFLADAESASLKFVGVNDDIVNAAFTYDPNEPTVEYNLFKGYAVATAPSGKFGCYRVEIDGTVTKAEAKDMLSDLAPEMDAVLSSVTEANKGFFIGSRAYSQAFNDLKQLSQSVSELGNPPAADKVAQLQEQLQNTMKTCKAYMDKKNPDGKETSDVVFKNDRERTRYEAMEKAFKFCKSKVALIDLQNEALTAEAMAEDMQIQQENAAEVAQESPFDKAFAAYKANVPGVSNVGNRAQEYHKLVVEGIEAMLDPLAFEPKVAQYLMAGMVTLEMVNKGRTVDESGNLIASDIEQKFATGFADVVNSVRDNPVFKAMTENVSLPKLRDFITNNGAKTVYETMTKNAEIKENLEQIEPVKQMEPTKNMFGMGG